MPPPQQIREMHGALAQQVEGMTAKGTTRKGNTEIREVLMLLRHFQSKLEHVKPSEKLKPLEFETMRVMRYARCGCEEDAVVRKVRAEGEIQK